MNKLKPGRRQINPAEGWLDARPPQAYRSPDALTGGLADFVQCLRNALHNFDFPKHLFLPRDAFPFLEIQTINDFGDSGNPGDTNTVGEVVFHSVPQNMNAFLHYFGQDSEDFTPGITDAGIDWFVQADSEHIEPFGHFQGILSEIPNPASKGLMNKLIRGGQRIHVDAQIRTTANGGLDGATADLTAVICGWQFHAERS